MTIPYDAEYPYAIVVNPIELAPLPIARFRHLMDANQYVSTHSPAYVIDTTPKPKVPKGAEYILFLSEDERQAGFARRISPTKWSIMDYDSVWSECSQADLEKYVEDYEVHVLYMKED